MLQVHIFLLLRYRIAQSITIISPPCPPYLLQEVPEMSQYEMKTGMSFCFHTSLDLFVGLCERPIWKSLLFSPLVCISSVAVFPFIISHWQVRAFLFCSFWFPCQNACWSAPADGQALWSIYLFRDFSSGKVLHSQWYLGGFQSIRR